jgi:uncharacterized membrane protein
MQTEKADFDRNREGLYGGLPEVRDRQTPGADPGTRHRQAPATIKNPIEWSGAQMARAMQTAGSFGHSLRHMQETIHSPSPTILRIRTADIREALAEGWEDFGAYRSDVLFLGVTYAVVGLVVARLLFGMALLPLLFPLASGFAIVGPLAAVGLYEMSRQRERGIKVNWKNAFDVLEAPAFGALAVLGMILILVFLAWLAAAWLIFQGTLGPQLPRSAAAFIHDVLMTDAGRTMIVAGVGAGFLFALLAMTISVVAFPLLLDHDVGLDTAIKASARAVFSNPGPMALWGLIVAGALVIGSIPLFVGLAVALPVLGHATWHLYRKLVRV